MAFRFTLRRTLWLGAALALACASALTATSSRDGGRIQARDLLAQLASERAPLVVDVRTEREFRQGHVPGAVHVSFFSTFGKAGDLDARRDEPVIVYCEHGPRAWVARLGLGRHGFENVLLLDGHMSGWRDAGLPIEKVE